MDYRVLLSTFVFVFGAELGDKTQLAVVTQTCKCRRPWPVFLGASLALTAVTAIGALGGGVVARVIPASALQRAAAVGFLVMGLFIARQALAVQSDDPSGEACDVDADGAESAADNRAWDWQAFGSTFGLLFLAEMGDKTQLAVLTLAGSSGTIWPVFVGGSLALIAVTALGVLGGESLSRLLPERVLLWVSALAFIGIGAAMALGML